jgi:hypothetical protein
MLHRAVFPLVVVSSLMPQQAPTSSEVENELRQRTQELLDAVAPGRVDVWRRLLHERMIHVDENGIVRTKSELLAEIQPLPTGSKARCKSPRRRPFSTRSRDSTPAATLGSKELR